MSDNSPDYSESPNVTSVHNQVLREKELVGAGSEPLSLWTFFLCGIILVIGGLYLGSASGGFSMDSYQIAGYKPKAPSRGSVEEAAGLLPHEQWVKDGKGVYMSVCSGCHLPTGAGQPGLFPPLAGSEYVTEGTERIAQIILKGLQGPITVKGQAYNGAMPAQATLSDRKIAQVISYIRSEWNNGFSPSEETNISSEQVAALRARISDRSAAYTANDLSGPDINL